MCANCGQKIWPEGDPDHGVCYSCFMEQYQSDQEQQQADEYYAEMAAQMEAEQQL